MLVTEKTLFSNSTLNSTDVQQSSWISVSQYSKVFLELQYNWTTLPTSGQLIVEIIPKVQNNDNQPIKTLYYSEFLKSGIFLHEEDIKAFPEFKISIFNSTNQDVSITLTIYLVS